MGVWETTTGQQGQIFGTPPRFAWTAHATAAWSPDRRLVVIEQEGVRDTLQVWEVSSGHQMLSWLSSHHDVWALAWSPDGRYIASGGFAGQKGEVALWEASTGRSVGRYLKHTDFITALAWSPDGRCLASGA